jgi:hypothetical protein
MKDVITAVESRSTPALPIPVYAISVGYVLSDSPEMLKRYLKRLRQVSPELAEFVEQGLKKPTER